MAIQYFDVTEVWQEALSGAAEIDIQNRGLGAVYLHIDTSAPDSSVDGAILQRNGDCLPLKLVSGESLFLRTDSVNSEKVALIDA